MNDIKTEVCEVKNQSRQMNVIFQVSDSDLDLDGYQPEKCFATDLADQYDSRHGVNYIKPQTRGWLTIPVLEFLNGRLWDNMALNVVHSLRPSCIRVTTGEITSNFCTWRVTIYLEQDQRIIRRIEQEVEVGTYGIRNGSDVNYYIQSWNIPKCQPNIIINPKCLDIIFKK